MALYESAEIVTATAGAAIGLYDAVLIKTADRSAFPVDDVDGGGIIGIAQEAVAAGDTVAAVAYTHRRANENKAKHVCRPALAENKATTPKR